MSTISFLSISVQSLSRVQLFATPWTAARQASLSITNAWSLLRLMSIESLMPSSHLILCRPLLLLPPTPPSIRGFSNESVCSFTDLDGCQGMWLGQKALCLIFPSLIDSNKLTETSDPLPKWLWSCLSGTVSCVTQTQLDRPVGRTHPRKCPLPAWHQGAPPVTEGLRSRVRSDSSWSWTPSFWPWHSWTCPH